MKKKILSAILVLTMLCSLIVVPTNVSAGYYSYMPLNIRSEFDRSRGIPDLFITTYNNTYEIVTGFDIEIILYDSSWKPIPVDAFGSTTIIDSEYGIYLEPYDFYQFVLSQYAFPNATAAGITLTKVYFENGTVWDNPRNGWLYEEANFEIGNIQANDGSYVIDTTHEVQLRETGYGMYKRDWYIWSDAVNDFVWFSDDINPVCTVWAPSATVKLVINNDLNKYKILSFNVTPEPNFNLKYLHSAEVLNSATSDYERFYPGYYGRAPYNIALWDVNEFYGSRSWYLWNDNYGWMLFSYDRGPTCQLWSEGEHKIALVYNNDWNTASIYEFGIY